MPRRDAARKVNEVMMRDSSSSTCLNDVARVLRFALLAAGLVLLFGLQLMAEGVGTSDTAATVVGTASDVNEDAIAGATVTLQGVASADSQTTTSNERGYFEFHNVKPGILYQVTIHSQEFADWVSPGFTVEPRQYKILTGSKLRIEQTQTTVNVHYSPVEVATEQVAIAEKQRVLGIIPNFYVVYDSHPEPLTTKLKFKLALRVSRDPVTIAGIAFMAGVKQAGNTPDYEQGASGYAKRFGATAADGLTDIMIGGAILPSLLHQDPRYFYQGTGSTKSRMLHALSSPFVCTGDNGHLQPNYSSLGGDLASSAIANAYFPSSNRGAGLVLGSFAIGTAERMAASVAQEFVFRKLTPKAK